jgi:hypothetical protein
LARAARAGLVEQQPQVAAREHREAGSGSHVDVEAQPLDVEATATATSSVMWRTLTVAILRSSQDMLFVQQFIA